MRIQHTCLHPALPTSVRHEIASSSISTRPCRLPQVPHYRLRRTSVWVVQARGDPSLVAQSLYCFPHRAWSRPRAIAGSLGTTSLEIRCLQLPPSHLLTTCQNDAQTASAGTRTRPRAELSPFDVVLVTCLLLRLRPNSTAHAKIPPRQKGAIIWGSSPRNRNRTSRLGFNPRSPRNLVRIRPRPYSLPLPIHLQVLSRLSLKKSAFEMWSPSEDRSSSTICWRTMLPFDLSFEGKRTLPLIRHRERLPLIPRLVVLVLGIVNE